MHYNVLRNTDDESKLTNTGGLFREGEIKNHDITGLHVKGGKLTILYHIPVYRLLCKIYFFSIFFISDLFVCTRYCQFWWEYTNDNNGSSRVSNIGEDHIMWRYFDNRVRASKYSAALRTSVVNFVFNSTLHDCEIITRHKTIGSHY